MELSNLQDPTLEKIWWECVEAILSFLFMIGLSESTPMAGGIPDAIKKLTAKFYYNDLDSAERMFADYPNQISCVILEAEKADPPLDNFLHKLRDLTHKNGAVFIIDEMITGSVGIWAAHKKNSI